MRTALEFHDSELASVMLADGDVVVDFSPGYVHQWEKRGSRWRGTGWSRNARVRVQAGTLATPAPGFPTEVAGGTLSIGPEVYDGLIPAPLSAHGPTSFRLELFNAEPLEVNGTGVVVELAPDGEYVEELPDEWAPDDNRWTGWS